MKPWKTIASTQPPDGEPLVLQERDGEYRLSAGGQVLMGSRQHGSEEALARVACLSLKDPRPHVLIGGLGFGFTLRAALDALPPSAQVTVAELSADLVALNRGALAHLARHPLEDPRVHVEVADVQVVLARAVGRFAAVMLDVDNGPQALSRPGNQGLYSGAGVRHARAALQDDGVLVVWSAAPDDAFARRLVEAGFRVELRRAAAVGAGKGRHVLFVAHRERERP